MRIPEAEREPIQTYTIDDLRLMVSNISSYEHLDHQKVRLAPLEVITYGRSILEDQRDPKAAAHYVYSAYEFYRGCVCWGQAEVGVPLERRGDIYEWLDPSEFSWSIQNQVIYHAGLAGRRLEDNQLDRRIHFNVDNLAKIYFMDYPDWQEDGNRYLLRPLRFILQTLDSGDLQSEVSEVLDRLSEPFADVFVKKYEL